MFTFTLLNQEKILRLVQKELKEQQKRIIELEAHLSRSHTSNSHQTELHSPNDSITTNPDLRYVQNAEKITNQHAEHKGQYKQGSSYLQDAYASANQNIPNQPMEQLTPQYLESDPSQVPNFTHNQHKENLEPLYFAPNRAQPTNFTNSEHREYSPPHYTPEPSQMTHFTNNEHNNHYTSPTNQKHLEKNATNNVNTDLNIFMPPPKRG